MLTGEEEERGTASQAEGQQGSAPAEEGGSPAGSGEEGVQDESLSQPGAEPGPDDNEEIEVDVDGQKFRVTKGFQKRINTLTKRAREAERRESYWRGRAEGSTAQGGGERAPASPAPAPSGPPKPPDPSDYEQGIYDPNYINDHDEYLIAAAEFRFNRGSDAARERNREREVHDNFIKRMNEAAKDDPLIDEMMNDPDFFPSNRPEVTPVVSIIKESDMAPKILSHLYTHRDELERILRLTPILAAREIGKLEIKISGTPGSQPKKVSQAPKPVKPVGDGGGGPVSPDDDDGQSTEDFMRRRNTKQYGRSK